MDTTVGRGGQIKLDGQEYLVKPGTYVRAESLPEVVEVSLGSPSFSDLEPSVSRFASSSWHMGYGLRRFSDGEVAESVPNEVYPGRVAPRYLESLDVDASEAGVAYLAPAQHDEDLPFDGADTEGPPVWMGEFGGKLVCIAGNAVFERVITGGWTRELALPAVAVKNTIGIFGAHLVIGYGSTRTAQYTDDLVTLANVTDGTTAIYVFAFTADKAAAYVAGGTASTDYNRVISSTDGIAYSGAAVVCGSSYSRITSLAPGGGVVVVFVGKETELGCIDATPDYRVLVPFDSKLAGNCDGLRWWLAAGGEEQRGPLILAFTRDYGLWEYQPSDQDSGSAGNMTPWSQPTCRPVNVVGRITSLQGTARWMYLAVKNAAGNSYVVKIDSRTGAPHSWLDLGANDCNFMTVSYLFGSGRPYLFLGKGNNTTYVKLPLYGDSPLTDSGCDFAADGTLDLPDIEHLYVDVDKVEFNVRVLADDLVAGQQYIEVWASLEGGAYSLLGTVGTSPSETVNFATNTKVKRVGIRLKLFTEDSSKTPRLRALVVEASLAPDLRGAWSMTLYVSQGSTALGSRDIRNPKTLVTNLWYARGENVPVAFTDLWNNPYTVRLWKLRERMTVQEAGRVPEIELDVVLLEVEPGEGNLVWDDALSVWDALTSVWG